MQTVAIIGSGTMGSGIAQAAALGGYDVILYDLSTDLLARSMTQMKKSIDKGVARGKTEPAVAERAKEAVKTTTSLTEAATADLIIEAVPEKMSLKREIFTILEAAAAPHAIFASNTSS